MFGSASKFIFSGTEGSSFQSLYTLIRDKRLTGELYNADCPSAGCGIVEIDRRIVCPRLAVRCTHNPLCQCLPVWMPPRTGALSYETQKHRGITGMLVPGEFLDVTF